MAKKTSSKEKRKTPMKMPMKMPMKTLMKKPASTHLPDDIRRLKSRLQKDIATHIRKEAKRQRATPTAPWKAYWRWCDDWAVLEPPTLQQLLTSSLKHGELLVPYEWPVKRHGQSKPVITQFEVNLATMKVKNMMTNTTCPLQLNGPL